MSEQIKQIASRIKELREISGISPESLSKELGVSKELYLKYESGSIDIPIGFLYEISNKFRVELTAILTGDGPKLTNYALVRKGRGVVVERKKEYNYQSLAYNFINKMAEPFLVTADPKVNGEHVKFDSHPGQEFNYMLEGKIKIVIDGREMILNEGDSLYFDSSLEHGAIALDDKPARFLAIIF